MTSIFYAPHADDEAIGMAGSIIRAVKRGDHVVCVLLTDSNDTHLLKLIDISKEELIMGRRTEFCDSCINLDVNQIFHEDLSAEFEANDSVAYFNFRASVANVYKKFAKAYPNAKHHVVSGTCDPWTSGERNLVHAACYEAALICSDIIDVAEAHRIYVYSHPEDKRSGPTLEPLNSEEMALKEQALMEYMKFKPEAKRYALGYNSAPLLFQAVLESNIEYTETGL